MKKSKWKPSAEDRRMQTFKRRVLAYQDEVLRLALEPIGRDDLYRELGWPKVKVTAEAFNNHPVIYDAYPLHMEVRASGKSNPPPVPYAKPLPALEGMLFEFPETEFHRRCIGAKRYTRPDRWSRGFAVIFPYDGRASLILHDRPDLAEGPALVSRQMPNGAMIQIHWFAPYIDDVADDCRSRFAEEESELRERIESNCDFRETCWLDWADREPPTGW